MTNISKICSCDWLQNDMQIKYQQFLFFKFYSSYYISASCIYMFFLTAYVLHFSLSTVVWSITVPMVAYFSHHLSDSYFDLSDLYSDFSDNYYKLSDLFVDLSCIYMVKRDHAQFLPSSWQHIFLTIRHQDEFWQVNIIIVQVNNTF